jgi:predicted alpha/beta superfamily hydrolase
MLLLLWLCLFASRGQAQELTQLKLSSHILGEERIMLVYQPRGYAQSEQRYPVLYLTDGEAQLDHTISTMEFLARNGRMPELLIVAITNTDRTRDLTPTKGTLRGASGQLTEFPTSGGGDKFLSFIEKELIPAIESKYRTHPYRLFAGHSFGGLLALHAFINRPDLFNAVIGASPSFDWDNHLLARRAEEFLKGRKELNRTLFFTLANEGGETRVGYDRFRALLSKNAPKGLRWSSLLMEDEDHGSVVLRSHYYGFRKIFEGWQMPPDPTIGAATGTWQTIEDHYRKLSERFGFPIPPPEALVNQTGYQILAKGWSSEAINVFKANVANYPRSANVYDSLGEAYEKSGKLELAKANYEKAVQTGEQINDPNLQVFRQNLQRVSALLEKNTKSVGQR